MRRIDCVFELAERVLVHPHLVDASSQLRLIENTDDDFFAVRRRQDRDTQVDLFAENLDAETSILRNASPRVVETGEIFEAKRNRELRRFGGLSRKNNFPIDAITQLERVLKRL